MIAASWKSRKIEPSSSLFAPKHLSVLHNKTHVLEELDVFQRIAADRDDVRIGSGRNYPYLAFLLEHHSGTGRCALDCVHRRHTELDHTRKFLRDWFSPWDSAHVCAEDDFHPGLKSLLERDLMDGSSQAVPLSIGSIGRGPIGV